MLEAIGRRSNLILLDETGRILDCMRRVESTLGSSGPQQRALLPGMFYRLPPAQDKLDPMAQSREDLERLLSAAPEEAQGDKWLLDAFNGLSPLVCRELNFQAGGATDARLNTLGPQGRARLLDGLEALLAQVRAGRFSPTLLLRDGAPWDFTFFPVGQYGPLVESVSFPTFSELLDQFYEQREHLERVKQRGQDLIRSVTTARDRTARKIAHQEQELEATRDRERLRQLGDILTSNFYQMERGMARLRTVDFYDPEGKEILIPLDPLLTPSRTPPSTTRSTTRPRPPRPCSPSSWRRTAGSWTISTACWTPSPWRRGGAGPAGDPPGAHRHRLPPPPRQGQGPGEAGVLQAHGVPLLLRPAHLGGQEQHPERPAHLQAGLQERHLVPHPEDPRLPRDPVDRGAGARPAERPRGRLSGRLVLPGRGGGKVPVDYTPVKYVKKPGGARPGMVVYTTYETAWVAPSEELAKRLRVR